MANRQMEEEEEQPGLLDRHKNLNIMMNFEECLLYNVERDAEAEISSSKLNTHPSWKSGRSARPWDAFHARHATMLTPKRPLGFLEVNKI